MLTSFLFILTINGCFTLNRLFTHMDNLIHRVMKPLCLSLFLSSFLSFFISLFLSVTYKALWYICGVDAFKILKWYPRSKYHISCIKYVGHVICDWWKGHNSWWNIKPKSNNFHRKDDLCTYKYIFINLNYVIFYHVMYNDTTSTAYITHPHSSRSVIHAQVI